MHNRRTQAAIDAGHPEWAELPVYRERAIALGEDWYFTGKTSPTCGHVAPRSISLKVVCVVCARFDAKHFGNDHARANALTKQELAKRLKGEAYKLAREKHRKTEFAKYLKWESHLNDTAEKAGGRANRLRMGRSSWRRLYLMRNCKGSEWLELPRTSKEARNDPAANSYFDGLPCSNCGERAPKTTTGACRHCAGNVDVTMCSIYRMRNAAGRLDLLKLPTKRGRGIYFSGSLCPLGHVSARSSVSGCLMCNTLSWGKRRVDVAQATPACQTEEHRLQIEAVYQSCAGVSTSRAGFRSVDHIIPLNHPDVCGLHVPWNLQVLSRSDNQRKNNAFDGTMENESWRVGVFNLRKSTRRRAAA